MKVYKILIITIIVLFVILGIRIHTSNNKQQDSGQVLKTILDKANDIKNYECEVNNGTIMTYKRYNNKLYLEHIHEDIVEYISYMDYDSNIWYYCSQKEDKICLKQQTLTSYVTSSNKYTGICSEDINYLLANSMEIVKVKEVKYNGVNCLKATLKTTQETPSYFLEDGEDPITVMKMNIWINMDNGLIMKVQENKTKKEIEYKYKFDTVTESDVTPSLSGYRIIEPK